MLANSVVLVHNIDHVRAALDVAAEFRVALTLQNPAESLQYLGIGYIKSMIDEAVLQRPDAPHTFICDAGNNPAIVQEAFKAGFQTVRFEGSESVRDQLVSIATQYGGVILGDTPDDMLDLCFAEDPKAACRRWCAIVAEEMGLIVPEDTRLSA
jgi:hypothetical protein